MIVFASGALLLEIDLTDDAPGDAVVKDTLIDA